MPTASACVRVSANERCFFLLTMDIMDSWRHDATVLIDTTGNVDLVDKDQLLESDSDDNAEDIGNCAYLLNERSKLG